MNTPRIRFILAVAALSALIASGCGTYRNATAYFNTYYNASHLFDQAVAELEKTPQLARDSNYFAPYKITGGIIKKFESVIEKCSKIIQFHGESGYVEDAILMIGKSYLYQNETGSAERKFKELIDNFKGSDHVPEARLWYAKSLYMGKNDDEALVAVKELIASGQSEIEAAEVDDNLLLEGLMLEAQIYADRGEADNAAATLSRITTLEGDGELKAVAQYQLGRVYAMTGAFARAATAYDLVSEFSPTPDMTFNAKLQKGVMLSNSGEHEAALETFDEIIEWPLKKEQSALVDFEVANTYWAMGDSAAAFTLYDIIDSSYRKTDASARAYFKRGDILQHTYLQLDKAKDYYSKARSEFVASAITGEARKRFTSLDQYFKTHAALAKDDSLFYVATHMDSAGTLTEPGAVAGTAPGQETGTGVAAEEPGAGQEKSAGERVGVPPEAGGRLQDIESLSMQALRRIPRHLVADPEDPEAELLASDETAGGAGSEKGKPPPKEKAATKKPDVAPAKTAGSTLSPEKLGEKIAAEMYELGGILYLDLGLPDSALQYYDMIVRDHAASPLVPRAIYAMSQVHRTMGDTARTDSLFDLLLAEYPRTEYADQVRRTRGLDTTEEVESPALARYRRAEDMLFGKNPEAALPEFKKIYATTTDSVVRPKACYAIGWIYENVRIRLDSADYWYKQLLKEYPSTPYASDAKPRVVVRDDTSKLKDYVKIQEIKAVPKPVKKAFGLIPTGNTAGQSATVKNPSDVTLDDIDYYDEDLDKDDEDDPDEEEEDDEEVDPDDDPGMNGPSGTTGGVSHPGFRQFPL